MTGAQPIRNHYKMFREFIRLVYAKNAPIVFNEHIVITFKKQQSLLQQFDLSRNSQRNVKIDERVMISHRLY